MGEGNFVVAYEEFRFAVGLLPDAVVGGKAHDESVTGFCASGIKLAEQRIAEGKGAEAESNLPEMLSNPLRSEFPPGCGVASPVCHSPATSIERSGRSFSRRSKK